MFLSTITIIFAALASASPLAQPDEPRVSKIPHIISVSPEHPNPIPSYFVDGSAVTDSNGTTTKHLAARNDQYPGVYVCDGSNWSGRCYWTFAASNNCYTLNPVLEPRGSFGPDHGLVCELHNGPYCGILDPNHRELYSGGVRFPGLPNVGQRVAAQNFHRVGSFKCTRE